MEVGTIIGDKVYYIQYIADAQKYSDYLPTLQKMIDSLTIRSAPMKWELQAIYKDLLKRFVVSVLS